MKTCKDCKYCTETNISEQIGLCTDTHTPTDINGNHKMQVRLYRQACMWYADAVPEAVKQVSKKPESKPAKSGKQECSVEVNHSGF